MASIIDLLLALVFCATLGHPVFVHNLCSEGKIFLGCPKPVGVDGLRQHGHSVFLDPLSEIERQVELWRGLQGGHQRVEREVNRIQEIIRQRQRGPERVYGPFARTSANDCAQGEGQFRQCDVQTGESRRVSRRFIFRRQK